MSDENKILQFPSHKVKKSKTGVAETIGQPAHPNRRMMLLVSLFSTMIFATILSNRFNERMNSGSLTNGLSVDDRNPASVSGSHQNRKDFADEVKLAKKIASQSMREPASGGRKPTAADIFQHGLLESSYAVSFSDTAQLQSVEFHGDKGEEKFLENRKQFLMDNAELMGRPYDEVSLDSAVPGTDDKKFEVYNLRHNGKTTAHVHFSLTNQDKFISMKVEPL